MSLENDLASSDAISAALDESTDNSQLAVFVRYVSKHSCANEELLELVAIGDTTKGVNMRNAMDSVLS